MSGIHPNNEGFIEPGLYRDILASMPIPCVDVVIPSSQGVLLVRRAKEPAKGQWWIPGGRIFKGETLAECAVRKAWEEVGLRTQFERVIHTEETIFDTGPWGVPVHSVNVCILLSCDGGQTLKLDPDHSEVQWYNRTLPLELHGYVRRCLEASGSI